jgi:PKD domain/WD40-like Beta Propeller Repeat
MKFIAPMVLVALLVACPSPTINRAPIAAFSISSNPANINTSLNFNASTSSDPDGDALNYTWNFGDTATGTGVTTSHMFAAAGRFTIGLTVSDGKLSNNTTQNLTINAVSSSLGKITYTYQNNVYRVNAQTGATPENVSALITSGTRKPERRLNISPDGTWLVLETQNLDPACDGSYCLAVAPSGNPASANLVRAPNLIQDSQGFPAISSDGNLIVYTANGGAHNFDLWAIRKTGSTWAAPSQITQSSTQNYNDQPAISSDGSKVLFDCGAVAFGEGNTSICEIGTNGTGFRIVVSPSNAPSSIASKGPTHHPDYLSDGSIAFDTAWDADSIWKILGSTISKVSQVNNNVAPCGLSNGKVASLWLERSGNTNGYHELSLTDNNGANIQTIVTGIDIEDIGIGCGG